MRGSASDDLTVETCCFVLKLKKKKKKKKRKHKKRKENCNEHCFAKLLFYHNLLCASGRPSVSSDAWLAGKIRRRVAV